jgi:hypothetical protein
MRGETSTGLGTESGGERERWGAASGGSGEEGEERSKSEERKEKDDPATVRGEDRRWRRRGGGGLGGVERGGIEEDKSCVDQAFHFPRVVCLSLNSPLSLPPFLCLFFKAWQLLCFSVRLGDRVSM